MANEQTSIEKLMETSIHKIKELVDANTIIGQPITMADGTTVIPVSKISFGFGTGGSDYPGKKQEKVMFGGGGGAGVNVTPVCFISIADGEVKVVPISAASSTPPSNSVDRLIDMAPGLIDKISGIFKNKKNKDESGTKEEPAEVADKQE